MVFAVCSGVSCDRFRWAERRREGEIRNSRNVFVPSRGSEEGEVKADWSILPPPSGYKNNINTTSKKKKHKISNED